MPTLTHILSASLRGIVSFTRYGDDGPLRECSLNQRNVIHTRCGDLVPRFSPPDIRSKSRSSVTFFPDGALRSVYLDEQTTILTPIGPLPAERVTFFRNGEVDSVFPLDGQISYSWSEDDERALAKPLSFEFAFGTVTAAVSGIRFYETGQIKSVLLWPGDTMTLQTPIGPMETRVGFRIYPSGELESLEPVEPITLDTPIGPVVAYDVDALGMNADENSVRFDRAGDLRQVSTSGDAIVHSPQLGDKRLSSRTRLALTHDAPVRLPITIAFADDTVTFDNGKVSLEVPIPGSEFMVLHDFAVNDCNASCDSCTSVCG
ncbi:hypothetical protein GCM10009785_30360 [Brooklawnia cerclae]|uniref:Uncharacterized protein n=1 Tax=Brooklawnia cerclae TaxID=349934 RepID=A0ABX0SE50_9ACTN|nr:hypothetical protein [Brooklawnia cerclae]NIH56673.1 hypothetical protein [Brooklawnia cerclae]